MAENTDWLRPGVRVTIKDKGFHGTVKFFGTTDFAPGKWVGVELDEPQGKNNGVVKGKVGQQTWSTTSEDLAVYKYIY